MGKLKYRFFCFYSFTLLVKNYQLAAYPDKPVESEYGGESKLQAEEVKGNYAEHSKLRTEE